MNEVRLAVERALSKLITRFGSRGDVIAELEHALALLKKQEGSEVPASTTPPQETEAPPAAVAPPVSESEEKPKRKKAEPRPQTRKRTGKGK